MAALFKMKFRFLLSISLLFSTHSFAQKNMTGDAFQTPSGNIHCAWEGSGVRCDILSRQGASPPKPKDCPLDYGHAFGLPMKGAAARICAGDTVAGAHPTLPYGAKWSRGGIECESEKTGLTCKNQTNHGFSLSKAAQKLF